MWLSSARFSGRLVSGSRWLSVVAATLSAMDELEFLRGRVYGADHDDAGPRQGRTYVELVAGPLDGLLLDVTDWPDHARAEDVALNTEMGRYGPGGRALYSPRPVDRRLARGHPLTVAVAGPTTGAAMPGQRPKSRMAPVAAMRNR
jgi:hypothetical protein